MGQPRRIETIGPPVGRCAFAIRRGGRLNDTETWPGSGCPVLTTSECLDDPSTRFIEVVVINTDGVVDNTLNLPKGSGNFLESQLGQEMKRDEEIVSGTIGTPLCSATWRTPFLKTHAGPLGPSGEIAVG
jgi:hypothetical protein